MSARFAQRRREAHAGSSNGVLLYLTNQSSFPPHSGGQLREWQLLSRLGTKYTIHFLAVTPYFERDLDHIDTLLGHCESVTLFEVVPGDGPFPGRILGHQRDDVINYVSEFLVTDPVDFVHVEGYFLMQHLPAAPGIPILLVEENIEYLLDKARQEVHSGESVDWTCTRELEHAAWQSATVCGTVSLDDAAVIHQDMPRALTRWLPSGSDHFATAPKTPPIRQARPGKTVVYTGNSSWGPSRDTTLYLIQKIWPLVLAEVPDATLLIAGSGQGLAELGLVGTDTSVHLLGSLPSLAPLLDSADIFVCPARFGGGVKMKILEALYSGCSVVSTPVGAQGLSALARSALFIGETTRELVQAIVGMLCDENLLRQYRAMALEVARTLPTWAQSAKRLDEAWSELVTSGRQGDRHAPARSDIE